MPELVSTLCTFLVLWPAGPDARPGPVPVPADGPGRGVRHDRRLLPVANPGPGLFSVLAEAARAAHDRATAIMATASDGNGTTACGIRDLPDQWTTASKPRRKQTSSGRAFHRWRAALIDTGHRVLRPDARLRAAAPRSRLIVVGLGLLARSPSSSLPILRREFFPEVDAGAFEIYVRAPSGTRIEVTEERIAEVEDYHPRDHRQGRPQLVLSELGVTPDWSAAYTPNAGPMDAVVKVQLTAERKQSAQEYVDLLRRGLRDRMPEFCRPGVRLRRRRHDPRGDERGQVDADQHPRHRQEPARRPPGRRARSKREIAAIDGVVDCPDHPAARLSRVHDQRRPGQGGRPGADPGRRHEERRRRPQLQHPVQQDTISGSTRSRTNQYFVGVQYPEKDIKSIETLLDIPITSPVQNRPIPLQNVVTIDRSQRADRGDPRQHAADDRPDDGRLRPRPGPRLRRRRQVLDKFGKPQEAADLGHLRSRTIQDKQTLTGSKIVLSGEYHRMQDTFHNLAVGLILASLLDLLPDGRAWTGLRRAADGHAGRAAVPGRRPADALLHRHGAQRAVAAGLHLHRRHQGGQHGADDRLRPGAAAPRRPDADWRRSARRPRSASGR